MDDREARLVADEQIAPDFGDLDVVVLAETARNVDHIRGDVEMEGRFHPRKVRPLRKGLEVVDRFSCLYFNHRLEAMTAVWRHENEIGIQRGGTDTNRNVLFVARVHPGFVLPPEFRMKEPDQPVVLQLFADGPHQNRAQQAPPSGWISTT
jgi:hypothetical protein